MVAATHGLAAPPVPTPRSALTLNTPFFVLAPPPLTCIITPRLSHSGRQITSKGATPDPPGVGGPHYNKSFQAVG